MNAERWRAIKDIFHAALEHADEERPSFLDQACSGDDELRSSVEQMLVADARENLVIDKPAVEAVAQLFDHETTESIAGRTFGHHEVEREVGRGGMGRVYLARDTRLRRPVALKLLPQSFSDSAERVRRFQQEARVVSALNHPNIITIHEIGEAEGLRFIVTEFVDGETLGEIIARGPCELIKAVKIIIQVTEALTAAHGAGIVHRDIKPENIMVRRDGYVKVLDFGIAKTNQELAIDDYFEEIQPSSPLVTTPGVLLGTVKYMSPEQARGEMVDARSDIFSLGVVLYEAVTGRALFEGATRGDLLAAIGEQKSPIVSDYMIGVPTQLQRIIGQALGKDLSERYQTAKEMQRDLETLRDGFASGNQGPIAVVKAMFGRRLAGEIKHYRAGSIIVLLLLAVVLSLGIYAWRHSATKTSPLSFDKMQFAKLTASGNILGCAISPDGKYFAYSSDEGNGRRALWLQQVETTNRVAVTGPAEAAYSGIRFSPDGRDLYYLAFEQDDSLRAKLYQAPASGGTPRKLFTDVYSAVAIAPNGKDLAFTRMSPDKVQYQLIVSDRDTLQERILMTSNGLTEQLSWSPDGKVITTPFLEVGADKQRYARIVSINPKTGSVEYWPTVRMRNINELAWSSDRRGVFITGSNTQSVNQIWYVDYPSGATQRVTNDLNRYGSLTLASPSGTLLTVQTSEAYNIWMLPADDPAQAHAITTGSSDYVALSWTVDGRLITAAKLTGMLELWRLAADGSQLQQLTFDEGAKYSPNVCGDGRYIVFETGRNGRLNLWRVNLDGTDLRQLSDIAQATNPTCLPNGKDVFFDSNDNGVWSIWRMPVDGGKAERLVDSGGRGPILSHDGRYLAYEIVGQGSFKEAIRSLVDQTPIKTIALPATFDGSVAWTPDGKGFTFTDRRSGSSEIYYLPLAGGEAKKLTDFKSQKIFTTAWSPDGKELAVIRGQQTSDVVELTGLK